jgi:hypothetical protein
MIDGQIGRGAVRGAIIGAAFGIVLPIVIFLWTMVVEQLPGPRSEALWLALNRVFAAGQPTVLAVDQIAPALQQSREGAVLYALLMIAVVANWAVIGALAGSAVAAIQRLRRSAKPAS